LKNKYITYRSTTLKDNYDKKNFKHSWTVHEANFARDFVLWAGLLDLGRKVPGLTQTFYYLWLKQGDALSPLLFNFAL
jgi:hypothetical protein